VLAHLTEHGDAEDLAVWREWETASKGRRQLTWSQGIRAMAGLAEQERSDEEVAEDDLGVDDLLVLDRDTWHAVAPVQIDLLDAAARGRSWRDRLARPRESLLHVVALAGQAALEGGYGPVTIDAMVL